MRQDKIRALTPNARNLGRNTLYNFVGQVTVAVLAVIMVPYIVQGLGYSSYGLLSLALMVFGSFSLLELGLGRATTKYVAEYLSTQEHERISAVIWTSLLIQIFIGLLGGLILALFTERLVSLINIQSEMRTDAIKVFYILACSAPLILGSSALRGALEGAQRFDLVNYLKITLNISTYLIPLIGAMLSLKVYVIIFGMLIARFIATGAYFISCYYVFPQIKNVYAFSYAQVSSLFSYAGWVAISNIVVPFLVQIDRYYIAALVSVASVTFYTVPFEALNGLWIIPGSITAVLFPAFSGCRSDQANLNDLIVRPINYILILLGPIVVITATYSHEIITVWQGGSMADHSSEVLRILVIGVLINSLSWVPSNLIMGFGRPDLIAKIHLLQTPLYLIVAYFFILKWNVVGAALAFTLRVSLETTLIYISTFRLKPDLVKVLLKRIMPSLAVLLIMSASVYVQKSILSLSLSYSIILSITLLFIYILAIYLLFDSRDKELLLRPFLKERRCV